MTIAFTVKEMKRMMVIRAMDMCANNPIYAARLIGITPEQLDQWKIDLGMSLISQNKPTQEKKPKKRYSIYDKYINP
jgi:hypothetical protein